MPKQREARGSGARHRGVSEPDLHGLEVDGEGHVAEQLLGAEDAPDAREIEVQDQDGNPGEGDATEIEVDHRKRRVHRPAIGAHHVFGAGNDLQAQVVQHSSRDHARGGPGVEDERGRSAPGEPGLDEGQGVAHEEGEPDRIRREDSAQSAPTGLDEPMVGAVGARLGLVLREAA
jgi:hypothetical protein